MKSETESLQPAPGLDVRVRPIGFIAAPTGTRRAFFDDLEEPDLADQVLQGFIQEDTLGVRRHIYNVQVSSEVHTSTLVWTLILVLTDERSQAGKDAGHRRYVNTKLDRTHGTISEERAEPPRVCVLHSIVSRELGMLVAQEN